MVGGDKNGRSIFSPACQRTYVANYFLLTTISVGFQFFVFKGPKKLWHSKSLQNNDLKNLFFGMAGLARPSQYILALKVKK
jgi:hypothetical protein